MELPVRARGVQAGSHLVAVQHKANMDANGGRWLVITWDNYARPGERILTIP